MSGSRKRRGLAVVIGTLAILVPSMALGVVSSFGDVDPGSQFFANIVNMANSGITTGAGGCNFCPKDNVTREQMAALLHRTAPRATAVNFSTPLGNTPGGAAANGGTVDSASVTSLNNEYLFISAAFVTFTYSTTGSFPCENLYRFKVGGNLVGVPTMYDRTTVPGAFELGNEQHRQSGPHARRRREPHGHHGLP